MSRRARPPVPVLFACGGLLGLGAVVWTGVASAGPDPKPAAASQPPGELSGYEIVRANFLATEDTVDGTARCSDGKMVLGGGGRVIEDDHRRYLLAASEPAGPSGWTAVFVRAPEPPAAREEPPRLPGPPSGDDGDEGSPPPEPEAHFEVSAICAVLR